MFKKQNEGKHNLTEEQKKRRNWLHNKVIYNIKNGIIWSYFRKLNSSQSATALHSKWKMWMTSSCGYKSGFCDWSRHIPSMMDLNCFLSSSKPRFSSCSSVPVKWPSFDCFIDCWICLRDQLLNRNNFLWLCIGFLLQCVQCFQNLEMNKG